MLRRLKKRSAKVIVCFISLTLTFTTVGSIGGYHNSYAETENPQATTTQEQVTTTPEEATTAEAALQDEATQEAVVPEEQAQAAEPKAKSKAKAPAKAPKKSGDASLRIASVEELTEGEYQSIYRDEVYKGDAAKGEDPDKYYTTYREINLKDPRIFNFEFSVTADQVGEDPDEFLKTVDLSYGGLSLDKWVWDGYDSRVKPKTTSVLSIKDKSIAKQDDGSYIVKIAMETDTAWGTSKQNAATNIPYDNYGAGRQFDFSTGQSRDNRRWWQAGPLKKGVGSYTMAATVGGESVAEVDIHIAPYDGMNSWIEINEYAQSIVAAINGEEVDKSWLNGQNTGTVAKGYVSMDKDGNFVKGTKDKDVYVEVSVLGYGLTDNSKEKNQEFNNYSKYNAIWNIAVAKSEGTVDNYLNETVPMMNENPQKLIDSIKDKDAKDIDLVQVYYQNNVHPDEVSGTDSMIRLTTELIKGGAAGQKIEYKTWTKDDFDFNYRDPAEGANKGTGGHSVKGGYDKDGRFSQKDTRVEKALDTGEALDNFIFVSTLCSNPDAKAGMRRTNRYAFDLNRDAIFSTMPETIALLNDIMKWDPLIMNEWHGYVTQMLIEPCTSPHDPAYDYDLLQNNLINLSYAAGMAVTANSGMQRFLVPWDHYDGGDWDDGGTIYAPMAVMLLGCSGFTVEFPYSNLDALDANDVVNYAMIDEALHGETEFFAGNRLNGSLKDVNGKTYASHEEDIKYTSMRKSTLMSKLETKVRGIKNVDAKETVDKYFIDKKKVGDTTEDRVVGRARPTDKSGKELSFFPDYIVIPTDEANQYNVAEGTKAMNQMLNWGIKVSRSTADVTYNGTKIPKGAYVLDMKQARRNVIFETMSKGYDATNFSSMYADIYCNLPDVRGFDSVQVYQTDLFKGKLENVSSVEKKANITGTESEYVVFKSQSTDAVRFVNLLLSGTSSGPSTSEKGDVWMLRNDVKGVGNASDYIIKASDLPKLNNLTDNAVLGLHGCQIEGKYIASLPEEATKLVEPKIQLNSVRDEQSGGPLWWMLDDYLGFGSMKDYNGTKDGLREGANVIISNNAELNEEQIAAVKNGTGVIFIRNTSSLNDETLGTGSSAPNTRIFQDIAIAGDYNIDSSLYTANYDKTSTYYARGYAYTNLPEGAKVLFQSDSDSDKAFIGGFQATKGDKSTFANATTMFSTILNNNGKLAQVLAIGQQLDYRPHYQKLLPLLATAIYADAAGIYDDQNAPVINNAKLDGKKVTFTAAEAKSNYVETGFNELSVYLVKGDSEKLVEKNNSGKISVITGTSTKTYKVVATDVAGNKTTKIFTVDPEKKTVESEIEDGVLAQPTNLTASNSGSAIALKWNAVEGADEYSVYGSTSKDGSYSKIATVTGTKYNHKVSAGTIHYYKVKAISDKKSVENSKFSATVSKARPLAKPVVKLKNKSKKKVVVSWKKVTNAKKYVVYRATSKSGKYKKLTTTTKKSYTDKKVKGKKTYYYKVKALAANSAANSPYSKVSKIKVKKY